ncbi:winged helix-turn-helix transcriptional regulator [Gemmobacter serpentinus]|uniref:winged helix-turn-helix transcriptional regulator n=1 Tax=Gemmobacter serpentinus TaxID=2652247 RepID=UPI00124F7341|nr:helix-turn-helix domain-containing protein [Gemmobacter serpentinus]
MGDPKVTKARSPCECGRISEVLSRVGDRWSTLVIYRLSDGRMRFNELKRQLGISQRMLSLTLRELERDGLVRREAFPTVPPRVDYELTPLGESLRVPIRALGKWALDNLDHIDAARASYDAGSDRRDGGAGEERGAA